MKAEKLLKAGGSVLAMAAVAALAIAPSGGAASAPDAVKSACKPAKNVEAIIDDSGSMSSTDPSKFRTQLLSAFASIGTNRGLIFGGVEFGSTGNPLFGPATIPAVNTAMQASFIQIDANNGGTDFDQAFAAATGHNGTADARIFLTDGLAGAPSQHLSPNVKTYVIGLGDIAADPAAGALLQQIASQTGGPVPALVNDASQVQPVAGAITALVNCKALPLTFTRTFTNQGQQQGYGFKPKSKTADILITWGSELAALDAIQITQAGGNKKGKKSISLASLAKKKKKKGKVKVVKKKGTTFVTLKLKKLRKGKKIKFKVKAKRLASPTVVTTQVIR